MQGVKKIVSASIAIGAITILLGSTAFAHVTIKPSEVVTAGFQTFTVSVPNEKAIATTSVKLVMPDGLNYVQPTQKTGWSVAIDTTGTGEDARVTAITWSGSEVAAGFRDDFTFSAQVPAKATKLQWKAYQTYADGTLVSWDKASTKGGHDTNDENSGPFSVTNVVATSTADSEATDLRQKIAASNSVATTALYSAIVAIGIGLVSVFFVTRKK